MKIGDKVYLSRTITEPADGDHPTFLMGEQGEQVTILDYKPERSTLRYLVEGPTNPGKPWYANREDLMHTKLFYFNT